MAQDTPSYWPDRFADVRSDLPKSILDAQAKKLAELTQQKLRGEVVTYVGLNNLVFYDLYLSAPKMDNYRFKLLAVWHDVQKIYPIGMQDSLGIFRDGTAESKYADSEEEFRDNLKQVLQDPRTSDLVASLMSYVA